MSRVKLVVVGGGAVGKSCSILRYVHGTFVDKYDPTIDDAFFKDKAIDDIVCRLDIHDTAGTQQLTALHNLKYTCGQGFILMYSVISPLSYVEISHLYREILEAKKVSSVPCVLVANKTDLTELRQVKKEEGELLAKLFGNCEYFETSAKYGTGIDAAFESVVRVVLKNRRKRTTKRGKGLTRPQCNLL